MSRGNEEAQKASTSGNQFSSQLQGNTGNLYSDLVPQLQGDIAHPTGFTPQQEADMTTAAEQSAGGTQAGAVGQGGLLAARTRNAGAPAAAISEAAREAGRQLSKNTLGIKIASAGLANQKRAQALGEMGGLYGTSTSGANNALGQVANNVDANSKAEEQSWNWAKYILDPAMQAAGAAGAAKLGAG